MNNLKLPQVAPNQNQKEVTINDQVIALDAALTETLAVDTSTGSATLSTAQFTRNFLFICSGHTIAAMLTIPATKRQFAVSNTGTDLLLVQVADGGSYSVTAGDTALLYSDGTNLTAIGSASGGVEYPGMAGNAGKVLAVNAGEDGVEWTDQKSNQSFAPHSGTTSSSSSAYAAKGGLFSPLVPMKIYRLSCYAAVVTGATYSLQLWSLDASNKLVAKLGEAVGLTASVSESRLLIGELDTPASVATGTNYVVLLVRTDSTGTTSCGATTATLAAAAAPVSGNTSYARLAKNSPVPGDVLETGSTPFAVGIFWSL